MRHKRVGSVCSVHYLKLRVSLQQPVVPLHGTLLHLCICIQASGGIAI